METPHLYRSLPLPNSETRHIFYERVHILVGSPVLLGGFLLVSAVFEVQKRYKKPWCSQTAVQFAILLAP